MATKQDIVRFLPNERADLPDMTAMQRNARSDFRAGLNALAFGDTGTFTEKKVLAGWAITPQGAPDATFDVAYGTALGAELLDDASYEYGVPLTRLLSTTQTVDMTGEPNNTYNVYVRFSYTAGVTANRIFWNEDTSSEEVDAMDTYYVADWDVVAATASPGAEYIKIGEVVWGGATIVAGNITQTRDMFFEGDEDASFAQVWGDGVNDRNTDRGAYGVGDLYTWAQAVRRQLTDIIDQTGAGWFIEVPVTAVNDAGAYADLTLFRDHYDDVSDPHGATLTQTNLVVGTSLTAPGLTLASGETRRYYFTFETCQMNDGGLDVYYTGAAPAPGIVATTDAGAIGWWAPDMTNATIGVRTFAVRLHPLQFGEELNAIYIVYRSGGPGGGRYIATLKEIADSGSGAAQSIDVFTATVSSSPVAETAEDVFVTGWTGLTHVVGHSMYVLEAARDASSTHGDAEYPLYIIVQTTVASLHESAGLY